MRLLNAVETFEVIGVGMGVPKGYKCKIHYLFRPPLVVVGKRGEMRALVLSHRIIYIVTHTTVVIDIALFERLIV